MTTPTTLSISDLECVLHKYQQVFALGKQKNNTPPLVATLSANICPSKTKIEIVFKKFNKLPDEVQQNINSRFQSDVNGLSPSQKVFHLISLPLQSRTGLSENDMKLSLSRRSEHDYYFPLVTHLEYDIKNLQSNEGFSKKEKSLVDTIQSETKKRFPNTEGSTESIAFIGEADNASMETKGATRHRRRKQASVHSSTSAPLWPGYEEQSSICNKKLLTIAALAGLLVASALTKSGYFDSL